MITDQGIKTLANDEAAKLSGENPDHAQQDLFEHIEKGQYPSWTCYVQTMTAEQAEQASFSVFDLTKVWPHKEYPLRRFGRLVLDKNPENYFAEVEQADFHQLTLFRVLKALLIQFFSQDCFLMVTLIDID